MKKSSELRDLLKKIDHRGYPAYKETAGQYDFGQYVLSIDHVQGDPFASPSRVSVHLNGEQAGFPPVLYDMVCKKTALEDYLIRHFEREVCRYSFKAKGSGKSGLISVSRCGQEILCRSACQIDEKSNGLVFRMEIGFPANGRTINACELEKILFDFLPKCVSNALVYKNLNEKELEHTAFLAEDQQYIRTQLEPMGLIAFVANGAVLPRQSGISSKPLKEAVVFQSPKEMEVTLQLPHHGTIKGMGIRKGITLIVGGGYHGKSTLLEALELGVYNHVAGDGREFVITDDTAMKIRAEDGRSIQHVDISMFINGLPNHKDTKAFCTENASGSTSQAANVCEAMEAGSNVLLIDEDTSATNFMIRDALMQRVVSKEAEPITPFIDRIEQLYEQYGISTILVAGSSGSYFYKAHHIIQMKQYIPVDITAFAKQQAAVYAGQETDDLTGGQSEMTAVPETFAAPDYMRRVAADAHMKDNERIKIKTSGTDTIIIDKTAIDMRYVEQLADSEQLVTLGYMMKYACKHIFDNKRDVRQAAEQLWHFVQKQDFLGLCGSRYVPVNMAMPRRQEIFACINRYRNLKVVK